MLPRLFPILTPFVLTFSPLEQRHSTFFMYFCVAIQPFRLMHYIFETIFDVRDYECDIEGIVNNAVYLHYAEHTRHLFLRSIGISFAQLHAQGQDAVVARMKLDFKAPLRCDDRAVSRLSLEKDGVKYLFHQQIYREADMQLCFRGDITLVCLINGQLARTSAYDEAFAPFLQGA